jgi:exonuclease SbcD
VRIAFSGDWHLGAQGSRLHPETGLNARLVDRARCARFVVKEAVGHGAEILLHGGDVFDGCRPSPSEVHLARDIISMATNSRIPTLLLLGNHDAPRSPAEKHALDLVGDMGRVTIVDWPRLLYFHEVQTEQGDSALECKADQADLQIACLPWPNKQLLLADEEHRRLSPGDLNQVVCDKMVDIARGLAASRLPGVPSILLGHFSLDMAEAGGMSRLMALGGDWTLPLPEIQALNFDMVLLAHIHKPQAWGSDGTGGRPVIYCGSPEAMGFGEEGEEKSFCLLEIAGAGAAANVAFARVPTPHTRFVTIEIKAPPVELFTEEIGGACIRVRLAEAMAHEAGAIAKTLQEAGANEVRIEVVRAEAGLHRASQVSEQMAAAEAIEAWLKERPDLEPLTADVLAEAQAVETALGKGGGS